MKADVLIIGGGPAGGMAALLFARAGLSTALCETHATLPERVCGMYLCPAGVALLERLGLRESLDQGARRLRGMVMTAPNFQRLETFFPKSPEAPDHGLALRRPDLDRQLLELAQAAGATIHLGARPAKIERQGEGWQAELPTGEIIPARLLVGADGRKSSTARLLGLAKPPRRSRAALHLDFHTRYATEPLGEMHVFEDGTYVGLDPITPETANFSFVCDPSELRGGRVVEFVNEHIARSPHLSALLPPVPADARLVATFPTNAEVVSAATDNAALIGDASGYTDPLTGEGIYGAFWTAEDLVKTTVAGWSDLPAALARYARNRQRRQQAKTNLCELFQLVIRRPHLANGIHWLLSRRQGVADSFIGIVGNSYSPGHGLARIVQHAFSN